MLFNVRIQDESHRIEITGEHQPSMCSVSEALFFLTVTRIHLSVVGDRLSCDGMKQILDNFVCVFNLPLSLSLGTLGLLVLNTQHSLIVLWITHHTHSVNSASKHLDRCLQGSLTLPCSTLLLYSQVASCWRIHFSWLKGRRTSALGHWYRPILLQCHVSML